MILVAINLQLSHFYTKNCDDLPPLSPRPYFCTVPYCISLTKMWSTDKSRRGIKQEEAFAILLPYYLAPTPPFPFSLPHHLENWKPYLETVTVTLSFLISSSLFMVCLYWMRKRKASRMKATMIVITTMESR
jgi:hypothetical protein